MLRSLLCLLLLILIAATAAASGPRQLHHFEILFDALADGAAVRVSVDFGSCRRLTSGSSTVATAAVSGFTVDLWEYVPPGAEGNERAYVVMTHATLVQHPRRGLITNLVTLTVSADDEVTIDIRHIDPADSREIAHEGFGTTIARGADGAATFHRLD